MTFRCFARRSSIEYYLLFLRQLEGRKTALDAAEDEHDEHELCCRPRRIVSRRRYASKENSTTEQ